MTKTILVMPISSNIQEENSPIPLASNSKRKAQYISGIKQVMKMKPIFDAFGVHVSLYDNTIKQGTEIDKDILNCFSEDCSVCGFDCNNYGKLNKGAGLVETWNHMIDDWTKYEFILHYEPRQIIEKHSFFQEFLKSPSNMFSINYSTNPPHFNTGIFAIETKHLESFVRSVNLDKMVRDRVSIEYSFYNFVVNSNIPFKSKEKNGIMSHESDRGEI